MKQAPPRAPAPSPAARRVKIQHILFLLLLLPGIIPLVLSSFYLLRSNRETLQVKEKELLTLSAQRFAQQLSDDLTRREVQLRQFGHGLVASPDFRGVKQRLEQPWAKRYLERFVGQEIPDVRAFHVGDQTGVGLGTDVRGLDEPVLEAMSQSFEVARVSETTAYRFALLPTAGTAEPMPAVAMAVPVRVPASDDLLVLRALVPVALTATAASQAGLALDELFLIDEGGKLLWSAGRWQETERALLESELIQVFAAQPVNVTRELELEVEGKVMSTLAQVVPVSETGWGVVAHKTTQVAFQQVRALVLRILAFSALAATLALVLALIASRGFSRPIQRLAEVTQEIAAGKFERRVSTEGLSFEVAELAESFNRMSDTVESYVARLQRAAEVNRQLFISSIRAFAAAIDAKDPYTRGHSERVASYSRAIARYLGLPKDVQEKVWISAVLHDVGKIGVEDRVLKKHGVLTPEEYDQMKLHPVIGADIVEPISALRDHLPGIRWHHEAWNGSGYPDGLKGEQIPLMARIIGVADTFDAITTNRPYQTASSPEFALKTIKKLTGTRFDAKIVTAFLLAWDGGHINRDILSSQPASPGTPTAEEVAAAKERLQTAAPRPPAPQPESPPGAPPPATPSGTSLRPLGGPATLSPRPVSGPLSAPTAPKAEPGGAPSRPAAAPPGRPAPARARPSAPPGPPPPDPAPPLDAPRRTAQDFPRIANTKLS